MAKSNAFDQSTNEFMGNIKSCRVGTVLELDPVHQKSHGSRPLQGIINRKAGHSENCLSLHIQTSALALLPVFKSGPQTFQRQDKNGGAWSDPVGMFIDLTNPCCCLDKEFFTDSENHRLIKGVNTGPKSDCTSEDTSQILPLNN